MKKKIVIILVAVIVIVGVLAVVVRAWPYRIYPSQIKEVDVLSADGMMRVYYLRVVAGGPNSCWSPWRYCVKRFGNIIFVEVLSLLDVREPCYQVVTWEEKDIGLGGCFIPGMKYKVVVNGVVETFVAE